MITPSGGHSFMLVDGPGRGKQNNGLYRRAAVRNPAPIKVGPNEIAAHSLSAADP